MIELPRVFLGHVRRAWRALWRVHRIAECRRDRLLTGMSPAERRELHRAFQEQATWLRQQDRCR
jgi:hypothetical protein